MNQELRVCFQMDQEFNPLCSEILKINRGEMICVVPSRLHGNLPLDLEVRLEDSENEQLEEVYSSVSPVFFPWMTVTENLSFVLDIKGISNDLVSREVELTLKNMKLWNYKKCYPFELTQAVLQRLAVARLYLINPENVFLVNPFSRVDHETRKRLMDELLNYWQELGKTLIVATNDLEEAYYMADKILFLNPTTLKIAKVVELDELRPRRNYDPSADEILNYSYH